MSEGGPQHVRFDDNLEHRHEVPSDSSFTPKLLDRRMSPKDVARLDWLYPQLSISDQCELHDFSLRCDLDEKDESMDDADIQDSDASYGQAERAPEVPQDPSSAKESYESALQNACLFREQAGRLLSRVEAATPPHARRLARLAAEMILHSQTSNDTAEEIRSRYLGEMDSEWAVEDSSVPCLPMPEAWTLHACASMLRKQGKEAAAIELEKLAQHASGSAGIPLMRRGSNTSCHEELATAASSVPPPGNINRKNSFRAGSKLEGVDDWELHGLVR